MDWLKEKIMLLFAPKYIGSVVRTLLATIAGLLISIGIPKESVDIFTNSADPILTGVILYIVTQGWSLLNKKTKSE